MSQPYVEFLVNHKTSSVLDEMVSYTPDPKTEPRYFQWKIVCDAAGKVVVRAREGKDNKRVIVIATATWRSGDIVDAIQGQGEPPSRAQWMWLAEVTRRVLEKAEREVRHPDASLVDAAEVDTTIANVGRTVQPPMAPAPAPAAPPPGPARPYVQFVLDHRTASVVPGSVSYQVDKASQPATPYEAKIVCDVTGKVVVRALDGDKPVVMATAVWRDDTLADRQLATTSTLDDFQWLAIEGAVRGELAKAGGKLGDPSARDEGTVDGAPPIVAGSPSPTTTPAKSRSGWAIKAAIGAGVAGLVIVAITIVALRPSGSSSSKRKPNGERCGLSAECASNQCSSGVCSARASSGDKDLPNGAACSRGVDCASGTCSSGMCMGQSGTFAPPKQLANGATCNLDADCASKSCALGVCRSR